MKRHLSEEYAKFQKLAAKKEKKPRGASAPEATSKRKGKAKATAKASQVEFRAKKPRGPPVKYADADGDYSDSSSS